MSEDETRPQPDPWSFPGATAPVDRIDSEDSQLPPSSARSDRVRRGVVTAAVVVLALGAAGAAGAALARSGGSDQPSFSSAAATSSPSASSGEQGPGRAGKGLKHFLRGGPGMLGGGLMGLAGALHGELVVPDGNGGYKTVVVQRGKTTSVSDTSITVKSDDGFTQTYDVGSAAGVGAQRDGLSGIKKGANVVVTGEKKGGSSVTADHVIDMDSFVAGGFGRFGGGPGNGHGPGAPQPAPTGTAGSSDSSFGV